MTTFWARSGAIEVAQQAGLLVLDIDGVLLDPRPSFYEAARRTSSWAAERILGRDAGAAVSDDEVAAFKAAGGWNDDFDLAVGMTWSLVARAMSGPSVAETASIVGGGLRSLEQHIRTMLGADTFESGNAICPVELIRKRSAVHYSGLERCREMYGEEPALHEGVPQRGLWWTEPVLCDAGLLRRMHLPLAFYTGRNPAEAAIAVERFEITVDHALRVVDDGESPKKPSPHGLFRLASGRSSPLVFIGDSIDDQRAALAYREQSGQPIAFARIVGPDSLESSTERAREDGADFVVDSLDALILNVWKERLS